MTTSEHPSYFALDALRLGQAPEPAVGTHLASCERCAAYLRGPGAPLPVPAWLAQVPATPRAAPLPVPVWWKRLWNRPWLVWPGFTVLAGAAALAVLVPRMRARDDLQESALGTREKGAPTLGVFIKRGERVFRWDGGAPLRPQDRLRFEVRSAGYRFVSVALPGESGSPATVLYAGELQPALPFLPLSFRVDDKGRQEVVSVVLGHQPIPARLHEASAVPVRDTWRQTFVFAKDVPDAAP